MAAIKKVESRINSVEVEIQGIEQRFQARLDAAISATNPGAALATTAAEFQEFQQRVRGELSTLKADILQIERRLEEQDKRLEKLESTNKIQCDTIQHLDNKIDENEQYSRRNCILLHGLPEQPDEDVLRRAMSVFKDNLNIDVNMAEIDRSHRVGRPRTSAQVVAEGGKRPIIVKFVSYQARDRVWRAKRQLKGLGLLITESLTGTRQRLFLEARERFGPRQVWTQDGRIVILKENGAKVYITNASGLKSITN